MQYDFQLVAPNYTFRSISYLLLIYQTIEGKKHKNKQTNQDLMHFQINIDNIMDP